MKRDLQNDQNEEYKDFYNLPKEQQILNIQELIQKKDIRTALQLAIEIKIMTRYSKLEFLGIELEDKMFILCTDLTAQGALFGLIETLFTFDFDEFKLPYIQIQLLLDVETFLAQNLPFNKKVFKMNNKQSPFYTIKELILTDQFTFIELKHLVQIIDVKSPLQYALIDVEQKDGLNQFFNRFQYKVETKQMKLLNREGFKECQKCKDLLEPQKDSIILCVQCEKSFIHNNCIDLADQLPFACSICAEDVQESHNQQGKKSDNIESKRNAPQQWKKLTPIALVKTSIDVSSEEDESKQKGRKKRP